MKNKIHPCIWFDNNAAEAVKLYCDAIADSKIIYSNPVVIIYELAGCRFMALNGGPMYKPNPTVSFYTVCETQEEVDQVWKKLSVNAKIMMPLDKYDWSDRYGWLEDRYGVSWQIALGKINELGQKVSTALMFVGDQFGKAEVAIRDYMMTFEGSELKEFHRYPETDEIQKNKVLHAQFDLLGQRFIAMDSGHGQGMSFTEGNSMVVNCDTQAEIDEYWDELSHGGQEGQCGWLKDKYGLSWQVVPSKMGDWMKDPASAARVTDAFISMKKLDMDVLQKAAESAQDPIIK